MDGWIEVKNITMGWLNNLGGEKGNSCRIFMILGLSLESIQF
jgi:hypothetical protein